ncbi:hypothetical protein IJ670_07000 [bacterium]|nr:hypothetical protein [bacterium]
MNIAFYPNHYNDIVFKAQKKADKPDIATKTGFVQTLFDKKIQQLKSGIISNMQNELNRFYGDYKTLEDFLANQIYSRYIIGENTDDLIKFLSSKSYS